MGRPVTIDDAKLLEAARDIFLEQGSAATTEAVARRAGISQASIFKRFKTKQELFLAAMHIHRESQDWPGLIERRVPEVGLRRALIELGVQILTFMQRVFPLLLLGWSNRGEFGFRKSFGSSGPAQGITQLVTYLQAEMDQGRLNRLDPWSVVRAFVGSLHSYVLMSLVTQKGIGPGWNAEDYVTGVVDVLWAGLDPTPRVSKAAPRRKQRSP